MYLCFYWLILLVDLSEATHMVLVVQSSLNVVMWHCLEPSHYVVKQGDNQLRLQDSGGFCLSASCFHNISEKKRITYIFAVISSEKCDF